jgi:hypothetical protein
VFGYSLALGVLAALPHVTAGVVQGFWEGFTAGPLAAPLTIACDTFADICASFLIVARTVFFLNLDYLRNGTD